MGKWDAIFSFKLDKTITFQFCSPGAYPLTGLSLSLSLRKAAEMKIPEVHLQGRRAKLGWESRKVFPVPGMGASVTPVPAQHSKAVVSQQLPGTEPWLKASHATRSLPRANARLGRATTPSLFMSTMFESHGGCLEHHRLFTPDKE